jgi:hypothetical protein
MLFTPSSFSRPVDMLDRAAMALSGLCVVHCVSTAVLLALFASVGGELLDPAVHEIGLAGAILLAAVALGRGIVRHGYMMPAAVGGLGLGVMAGALSLPHGGGETVYTIIGVAIVALGHDLNRRAANG